MQFLPILFMLPLTMSLTLAFCRIFPRHRVEHTANIRGSFDPLNIVVASETVTNEAGKVGANKEGRTFAGDQKNSSDAQGKITIGIGKKEKGYNPNTRAGPESETYEVVIYAVRSGWDKTASRGNPGDLPRWEN
ncbi:hypothetical protein EVAR_4936_1 [Eumeta japonica]|uniref:Uncharacterized protein n=1 Tax=Eumeta variegata TaxID=151549 RepID=A0A4C1UYY3_EUMVA|nr:hypothetical protein EVAR_4936_1 [Eumeta japonica]